MESKIIMKENRNINSRLYILKREESGSVPEILWRRRKQRKKISTKEMLRK